MAYNALMNDETEIRVWAELESTLGREPDEFEFQTALNKAEEDAYLSWMDNHEARLTGN